MSQENTREQFMRIATARLKTDYPFYPQRIAVAASMYRRWYDKTTKRNESN